MFMMSNLFRTAPNVEEDEKNLISLLNDVVAARSLSILDATNKFGKA